MTIGDSSARASGSTYFFAFSFTYVTATSAPSARNALAHPQAIDCSLAIPTTRPFFPSRSFAFTAGSTEDLDAVLVIGYFTFAILLGVWVAAAGFAESARSKDLDVCLSLQRKRAAQLS